MNNWLENDINKEIARIQTFICNFVLDGETVVVPVSGGLDSDVVARLCCRSLGSSRVKASIVIQSDREPKFLKNAKNQKCVIFGISVKKWGCFPENGLKKSRFLEKMEVFFGKLP